MRRTRRQPTKNECKIWKIIVYNFEGPCCRTKVNNVPHEGTVLFVFHRRRRSGRDPVSVEGLSDSILVNFVFCIKIILFAMESCKKSYVLTRIPLPGI